MTDSVQAVIIPVVTLLLGYATKSITDAIDYRRVIRREREARRAAKQDKLFERRNELQRQTLIELQDAVMQLSRTAGATNHHDEVAFKASGKWQKQLLPTDLDEESRLAQARTSILSSRVRDDEIRRLTDQLKSICSAIGLSGSQSEGRQLIAELGLTFEALNFRIGDRLRKLDDADEA